jgi:hypothetical protein
LIPDEALVEFQSVDKRVDSSQNTKENTTTAAKLITVTPETIIKIHSQH